MEEIKSDIYTRNKKIKALQRRAVTVLTKGRGLYDNPTDYGLDMRMVWATGARWGTAQAGGAASITLASADGVAGTDTMGKEIAIVSGTGVGQVSQVTSYNTTTKVATVSPAWAFSVFEGGVTPDATSGYVVLDRYQPLTEGPHWELGRMEFPTDKGEPTQFFPRGDSNNGGFYLGPVPYRDDDQPMIVFQYYYADLTEADRSGTLMNTLYQKWRKLFIAGIRHIAFQNDDDSRAPGAFQEYQQELMEVTGGAKYGENLSELQGKVGDY